MSEFYTSAQISSNPGADDYQLRRRRKFWLRAIWISFAAVIVPLMFGLVSTVAAMAGTFGELSKTGGVNAEALAGDISDSLLTTMWGLVVSAVAFFVLIGVLIRFFTLPKVPAVSPGHLQSEHVGTPNL